MGADIDGRDGGSFAPLLIRGRGLTGVTYRPTVASAQVKSAVLIAGLGASGPTVVHEPAVTRRHTEEMLAARGATIRVDGTTTYLEPSTLQPRDEAVPGDPSQAAFWLATAAAVPGSNVTVADIYLGPARDGFIEVLRRMGAAVEITPSDTGAVSVRVVGGELLATEITAADVPGLVDEIPVLAVAAALAPGVTQIRGAAELRVKESDRLATVAAMLRAFGIAVTEYDDGLDITGGTGLRPARVDSHGDHRIAMAAAMGALAVDGETVIDGFASVATSYPSFLTDLEVVAPGALAGPT
jgi:3-phosphoshikimate 1-carboxyvinyltransferase